MDEISQLFTSNTVQIYIPKLYCMAQFIQRQRDGGIFICEILFQKNAFVNVSFARFFFITLMKKRRERGNFCAV